MKLQPKTATPEADYPSYKGHHLSRRGIVGGAAALLLAQGCGDSVKVVTVHETLGVVSPPAPPTTETNATTAIATCETAPTNFPRKKTFRLRGLVARPNAPKSKPPLASKPTLKAQTIPTHDMLPPKHPTAQLPNFEVPRIEQPEIPAAAPDAIDLTDPDSYPPTMPGFIVHPAPPGATNTNRATAPSDAASEIRLPGEVARPNPPTVEN